MVVEQVETVDVTALWSAQLGSPVRRRRAPGADELGPRGWTVAVAGVLAPYTSSVHVPWAYHDYAPVGSTRTVHEVNGDDGFVRFAGVGSGVSSHLLEQLTDPQLEPRQGDGPSLGATLRAAIARPGVVELHGYALGPGSGDERIVVEGVFLYALDELEVPAWPHDGPCDCTRLWETARDEFGLDDARGMPQVLQRRVNPWRPGQACWQLAWE